MFTKGKSPVGRERLLRLKSLSKLERMKSTTKIKGTGDKTENMGSDTIGY